MYAASLPRVAQLQVINFDLMISAPCVTFASWPPQRRNQVTKDSWSLREKFYILELVSDAGASFVALRCR
jgi:hypothetical protein